MLSLETAGKLYTHSSPYQHFVLSLKLLLILGWGRGSRASSQNLRLIRHCLLESDHSVIWLSRRRWNPSTCQLIYTNGPISFLDLNRKVKCQNSCPFFFWLQLKGYSFSALELKLYQEAVLCKGGTHKFVLKSEPWAQKTREKASVGCGDKVLTLD